MLAPSQTDWKEAASFKRGSKAMSASANSTNPAIPGYDYGSAKSASSPLTDEELRQLEQTVGWSDEDAKTLHKHEELFRKHAEEMVDSWRSVIAKQPHLAHWFTGPDGKPDDEYKSRVKARFVQWVVDVATRPHDRAWLNYQEEIGLRGAITSANPTKTAVAAASATMNRPRRCRGANDGADAVIGPASVATGWR